MSDDKATDQNADACPGCGCEPGAGLTDNCNDEYGCGYWRGADPEHNTSNKGNDDDAA